MSSVTAPAAGIADLLAGKVQTHFAGIGGVLRQRRLQARHCIEQSRRHEDRRWVPPRRNKAGSPGPALYPNLKYDFIRDTAPVAGVAFVPIVMVVGPSSPLKTVADFVAYAKANPTQATIGTTFAVKRAARIDTA